MNVVLVGGGNITRTRHIPSVRALGYRIHGVIGISEEAVRSSSRAAGDVPIFVGDVTEGVIPPWLEEADLVVIGTPPRTHAELIVALKNLSRARIVSEKPFVVEEDDIQLLGNVRLDEVGVMHNFQFARGFLRAKRLIAEGRIGEIRSVRALQWSTKDRRLPDWYRDLPLGLFWDEAAHFVYLATDLVGDLELDRAWAMKSREVGDPTPSVVGAFFRSSSGAPVEMSMNFDAAISEWGLVVAGSAGTLFYDLFRDISVLLPHDGLHTAPQILRTSALATAQHWYFTVMNGQRYVRRKHLYGIDEVLSRVATSAASVESPIDAESGFATTRIMRDVAGAIGR